uniref:Transmembrane protein 97 n=1 Tax=Nothoprocta perdicaria TaxID=30464 RepID=A0A8C7EE20_NOTPE
MAAPTRLLEWLFALYFLSHIPITLMIDLQPLLPAAGLYPESVKLLQWYAVTFRDPMMMQPPEWFKSFIFCEAFLQLPFFPVAAYAFLKGWYKSGRATCHRQHFCRTFAFCIAIKVYPAI